MQSRRHNRRPEKADSGPDRNTSRQNRVEEVVYNLQRQHQVIGLYVFCLKVMNLKKK